MIEVFSGLSCMHCSKNSLIETPKRKKKNLIFKLYKTISRTRWAYILECPHCHRIGNYSIFSSHFTYIRLLTGAVIGVIVFKILR